MNRSRIIAVLGAAVVLVAGVQIGALAATGQPLLLGKSNSADKTTVIKVKKSKPALKLKTRSGVAPLKITSSAKVARLNADTVDGKDSSALATTAYTYTLPVGGTATTTRRASFPGLPAGSYQVSYAIYGDGATALSCYLRFDTLSPAVPRIALSSGDDVVSSTDVLTVPAAPALPQFLRCESTTPFTFGASTTSFAQTPTVTFLRLDQQTVAASN